MKDWFRRTLIPHEANDFQPHALQKAAMAGMLMLVLISFSIANLQSLLWIGSDWLVSTILPAVVTEATNKARGDEGRPALARSAVLDQAAQLKADDMAANGYFAHWSPAGVSPWHWFEAAGYKYAYAGENLAVHFTDSTAVVEAWLDSPTHRDNIMNDHYTEIGIGTAKGRFEGYDTVFVVQLFGTPAAPTAAAPAPSVSQPEPVAAAAPTTEPETASSVPEVAGAETTADVDVTENGTVVYESFAATAADDAAAAVSDQRPSVHAPSPSTLNRALTSPRLWLQIAYSLLGLLIAVALIISIVVEWRRQHPVQIAYAFGLLLFMLVLFEVHLAVSAGATIA